MAQALLDVSLASVTTSATVQIYGRFNVQMTGDFVGTVAIERSRDGTLWAAVARDAEANTCTYVFSSAGEKNCSGLRFEEDEQGIFYRINATVRTSGTVRVQIGVGSVILPGQRA
jgi:hypothetical protein